MSKAFIIAVGEEVNHMEEIHGVPVFISGVGKVNAAIGAQELVSRGVTEIINIGSCGSTKHKLGEIIRVGRSYQDIDCSPICEYGLTAFEEGEGHIVLDPESEFSCFTTDYFFDHRQMDKYSPHYLKMINQSSVFDMELYPIAKVARRSNIKMTAYKWVSDDGDFSQWQENCRVSSHKVIDLLADHFIL